MKKVSVEKHEGIAEVIDRILGATDDEILLVVPKGSELAKSASNFRLLKREADSADKQIVVVSLDPAVLAFARDNDMETEEREPAGRETAAKSHPHAHAQTSDIVPRDEDEPAPRRKKGASIKLTVHAEHEDVDDEGSADDDDNKMDEPEKIEKQSAADRFFKPRKIPPMEKKEKPVEYDEDAEDSEDDGSEEGESRGSGGKVAAWVIGVLVLAGIVSYAVTVIFGHAQVLITFTKTPWNYQANFVADKSATAIDSTANIIPAQVFTTQKNITQLFPATGQAGTVGVKAQGTITIYNNYSAAPQDLVATTRFVTPDGKIFRITTDVTVPGMAASGTPGSITAPIIADQAGPAYNVGPVDKLMIPGFAKSPKYTGFYGSITSPTTGGFIGTRPVPTTADIANAKTKTTAILQSDLQSGLTSSYPGNFQILDGATDIQISKLTVSTSTDQSGNFSVFGEATLQAIGFDEAALKSYLLGLAQNTEASSSFAAVDLNYGNVQTNFSKGQVAFSLSVQGSLEPAFSPTDFAAAIAGKSVNDARSSIASLPQLSNGTISVWPIWLWNMPSNSSRISVKAD